MALFLVIPIFLLLQGVVFLTTGVVDVVGASFIATSRVAPSSFVDRRRSLPYSLHHSQQLGRQKNLKIKSAVQDDDQNDLDLTTNEILLDNLHTKIDDFAIDFASIIQRPIPDSKNMELWLDLRDTALLPKAAMDYLSENLEDFMTSGASGSNVVDRVILSEEAFARWATSSSEQKDGTTTPSILYVPSTANGNTSNLDLILSSPATQQSLPCGKVIQSQASGALFNPVLALDIVMTEGGWILMEPARDTDEVTWLGEVTSLVTFLMASSVSSSSGGLGGGSAILLPSDEAEAEEQKYATPVGKGIALACSTASLLMEVSKLILTQTSLPTGTTTSEGGILLPASDSSSNAEEDLKTIISLVDGNDPIGDNDQLPVAVVLPLDIQIWQTALYLMSDCEATDMNEGDDEER